MPVVVEPPCASAPAVSICTTSLALPTTTTPPSPLVHFVAFMRAVQFWPQHPIETHDSSLARNNAKSPPSASSLGTTLTSSSDLPAGVAAEKTADRDSDHEVGDECDKHAPPETSSRSSVAFMRALQTVCCRERGREAASSLHASDHEARVDSSPPSPRHSPPPPRCRQSSGAALAVAEQDHSTSSDDTESADGIAEWETTLDWCKATARDGEHSRTCSQV
ncbi:hypothetical protein T484DRAFT_1971579 [Baffinella frigidus]|nr:hypothetical protein T484DRAFT_1971579 [Cryptophyta sp. CCMP2293]